MSESSSSFPGHTAVQCHREKKQLIVPAFLPRFSFLALPPSPTTASPTIPRKRSCTPGPTKRGETVTHGGETDASCNQCRRTGRSPSKAHGRHEPGTACSAGSWLSSSEMDAPNSDRDAPTLTARPAAATDTPNSGTRALTYIPASSSSREPPELCNLLQDLQFETEVSKTVPKFFNVK